MEYKIFVAGVWGFGNISIMEQFRDDPDVEFLKHDFKYFFQMQKAWNLVKRKLNGHGAGLIKWLLKTKIFDDKYALSHCDYESNDVNYVVIFNSALLQYYSREYFVRLKRKHPSIQYILYIIDPMPEGLWKEIEATLDVFEEVLTIHPYNCNRFGFKYLPYIYAKPEIKRRWENIPDTNLFFCGVAEDYRQEVVNDIVSECDKRNIDFEIYLKPCGNDWIEHEHVHYSEMSYEENVQRILKSKCILEIMHQGYVGITQRYLEAIIYNKKLLTNNEEVMKLPYYDTGYIKYFSKIDEIDWEWTSKEETVDYHYQGDFEPQAWKKRLIDILDCSKEK